MGGPSGDASLLRKYRLLAKFVGQPMSTIAEAAVLMALIERLNNDKGCAWPSLNTLAEDVGRNQRTVQRCVARLVAAGFVEVLQRGNRTTSNRYAPRFDAGCGALLGRDARAPRVGAHTPLGGRGADAARGRGVGAPLIHPIEPIRVQEEGGATAPVTVAVPGAATLAVPTGIDAVEWGKLIAGRPDLNPVDVAEQVEYHRTEGCPVDALNRALIGLRLQRGHKSLSPNYRRARPSKQPNAPARKDPTTTTSVALKLVSGRGPRPERLKAHPVQTQYRRITLARAATREEKDRLAARMQAAFPRHFAAIKARPAFGPPLICSADEAALMLELIAAERALIDARLEGEVGQPDQCAGGAR